MSATSEAGADAAAGSDPDLDTKQETIATTTAAVATSKPVDVAITIPTAVTAIASAATTDGPPTIANAVPSPTNAASIHTGDVKHPSGDVVVEEETEEAIEAKRMADDLPAVALNAREMRQGMISFLHAYLHACQHRRRQ